MLFSAATATCPRTHDVTFDYGIRCCKTAFDPAIGKDHAVAFSDEESHCGNPVLCPGLPDELCLPYEPRKF